MRFKTMSIFLWIGLLQGLHAGEVFPTMEAAWNISKAGIEKTGFFRKAPVPGAGFVYFVENKVKEDEAIVLFGKWNNKSDVTALYAMSTILHTNKGNAPKEFSMTKYISNELISIWKIGLFNYYFFISELADDDGNYYAGYIFNKNSALPDFLLSQIYNHVPFFHRNKFIVITHPDVMKFIDRCQLCEHWQGEEGYDEDRKKEINNAIVKLRCESIDKDRIILQQRYKTNKQLLNLIKSNQ